MKLANANQFRTETLDTLVNYFADKGEDIGVINSNTLNFPIVVNGEEGWCEVIVKVTKDCGDDGYMKREQYADKVAEKEIKAKEKAKAKAEKIARDNAKREKAKAEASA